MLLFLILCFTDKDKKEKKIHAVVLQKVANQQTNNNTLITNSISNEKERSRAENLPVSC